MTPYGDRALRFEVAADAPRRALLDRLGGIAGVLDVVLAETLGCIVLSPDANADAVSAAADAALAATVGADDVRGVRHVVDVVYDGEDLAEVARTVGRPVAEIVRLHAERDYSVAMLGFLPGFAYLRGLPEALRLPRRAPRPRVPAGSVAIAADYTGIYPSASAGGWHLLGRAVGFAPFAGERPTFAVGDRVHFVPSAPAAARSASAPPEPAPPPRGPHLEVARIAGLALFVDRGRPGRLRDGIPPGGPLVPSALAGANGLAGNPGDACGIELTGAIELVARDGRVVVADGERRVELVPGDRFAVTSGPRTRVAYVACAGGLDAPLVLGGRSALLSAGIGRPLARGDRVGVASGAAVALPGPSVDPPPGGPIAVVPGPDVVAGFSLEEVARARLRISPASSRAGTRLEGYVPPPSATAAMAHPSAPMIEGAIELTPSGLVVLGPDHPTTGGYPVVGVVAAGAREAFFSRPLGAAVEIAILR